MADYYPLLVRALEGLAENGRDERGAIYDRARNALIEQLRSVHPPLSEADITRERLALDEAIDRVESEAARGLFDPPAADEPEEIEPYPEAERASRARRRGSGPAGRPLLERAAASGAARERPKVDSISPSIRRPRSGNAILAGAALLIVVAGIAVAAWFLRDRPGVTSGAATLPRDAASSPGAGAPPGEADTKFSDRVSGGGRVSQAGPGSARSAQSGPRTEVAVAQRAVLLEENAADPKTPKITNGRALWRLENVNAGQGQPLESVIRADVEVPEAKLSVTMQIRRNLDPTLPASHTVLLSFRPDPQDPDRAVKDVGRLQFKDEEAVRGTPIAGVPVPVKDNVFLIGLSDLRGDVERNIEMLTRRNWIDLPIKNAKGQRAILSFEKGVSGEQVVNDALRQWGQL